MAIQIFGIDEFMSMVSGQATKHVYEAERCAPRAFTFDYHYARSLVRHEDHEVAMLEAQLAVMNFDRRTLQ